MLQISNVRHTVQKRETEKWKRPSSHKEQTHKNWSLNVGRESTAHLNRRPE